MNVYSNGGRHGLQDIPMVEISIRFGGHSSVQEGKQVLLRPLLDINHPGTELNLLISHEIIEGHNGSLDLKREGDINTFTVRLPVIERKGADASVKRGYAGG